MPSRQSRVLRLSQRGFRLFYGRSPRLDVEKERRDMDAVARMFKPLAPVQGSPVVANDVPAEWIVPAGLSIERVVLYLHGGAFNSGSIAGARSPAGNIALAGKTRALLIDYRLAPEHPFPAAVDDTLAAYEWLLAGGIPGEQIVVVGDSAGGTLALALLVKLRDQGKPLPALAVCLSPATDLTMSGVTWTLNARNDLLLNPKKVRASIELYLRGTDPRTPLASPLYADLRGFPPLLIHVGSDEFLLSDATRLAEKAKEAGVSATLEVWQGMQHGWHILASFLPEGRRVIARIGEFIASVPSPPNALEEEPAA